MTDEQWRSIARHISVITACLVGVAFMVGVFLGLMIGGR